VRALIIGDLPTNLGGRRRSRRRWPGALLYELSENAQQIMYDSRGWVNPVRGVGGDGVVAGRRGARRGRRRPLARGVGPQLAAAEVLAAASLTQALDPVSAPGAAETTTDVLVEHGPHAVVAGVGVGQLLSRRLGWRLHGGKVQPGFEIAWTFSTARGPRSCASAAWSRGRPTCAACASPVTLDGRPAALNLVAEDHQRLSMQLEGVDAAPLDHGAAAALRGGSRSAASCPNRERDPVFVESMAVAQVMAQSLL